MDNNHYTPLILKKKRVGSEMSLQITSMADIFTILLVFLLKNYATSNTTIVPNKGLQLPIGRTDTNPVEATRIEISKDAILVDSELVARLTDFQLPQKDILPNGALGPVDEALKTKKKRQVLIAQSNSDVKENKKILIVSDQQTPYSTLKPVLAAAGYEGFSDYQLVVMKKE